MSTDVMTLPSGASSSDDLGAEIELRELVYQALERDGLISRLKAQLRAAVFTTIEKSSTSIPKLPSHTVTFDGMTGRVCRALVLDWLEHSKLFYTEDVFKVETTGAHNSSPLTRNELLEQLHIKGLEHESQPLLHSVLHQNHHRSTSVDSLPENVKQSIDQHFPNEKISDIRQLRDHFHALFSSTFDDKVLDAYLDKNLSSSSQMTKSIYEQVCLKWMQACANALTPKISPLKQNSANLPTPSIVTQNLINSTQIITPARRSTSASSETSSSSSSPSANANDQGRILFDFPSPSAMNRNQSIVTKPTDIPPPLLVDFDQNDSDADDPEEIDDNEEDTSASILSKRNATPAALSHLKMMEKIIQGDETPRTRTTIEKLVSQGTRNLPVEYDDESFSQSHSHSFISSADDVTVDKVPSSPSGHLDFIEDF